MNMDEWIEHVEREDTTIGISVKSDNWKKRSIYKVPDHIHDLDKDHKLYRPVKVSLGPYYHDDNELKKMEEHKTRALRHFLKRSKKPLKFIVEAVREELENFCEAYDLLDSKWTEAGKDKFLQLMIHDGCFILEVLNVNCKNVIYAPTDPTFGIHVSTVLPLIKRDMLLLGNQVPFRVVRILFDAAEGQVGSDDIPEELSYLLLRFFSTSTSLLYLNWSEIAKKKPLLHLLDVYRKVLLYDIVYTELQRV